MKLQKILENDIFNYKTKKIKKKLFYEINEFFCFFLILFLRKIRVLNESK